MSKISKILIGIVMIAIIAIGVVVFTTREEEPSKEFENNTKNENRKSVASGSGMLCRCFYPDPPNKGSGKSGRASQDAGRIGQKKESQ